MKKVVGYNELPIKVQNFLEREKPYTFSKGRPVYLDWLHSLQEWRKATNDERLAYAEWRYPKGTKLNSGYIISGFPHRFEETILCKIDILRSEQNCQISLYHGRWSEIISEPEKEEGISYNTPNCPPEIKEQIKKMLQQEFKAGEIVEVWDDGCPVTEKEYAFFQSGKHWVYGTIEKNIAHNYDNIRKPDPDSKFRELAREIMKGSYAYTMDMGRKWINETDVESMLIEALKKGKEL